MSYAKRCVCGAVTVTVGGEDISMPYKEYKDNYSEIKLDKGKYSNCNYCVNHWGTNICKCGSGKKIGRCNCKSKESSAHNGRNKIAWR